MRLSARLIRPTPQITGPVTVCLTRTTAFTSRSIPVSSVKRRKQSFKKNQPQEGRDRLSKPIPYGIFISAVQVDRILPIPAKPAYALARQCVDVALQGDASHSVKISEKVQQDASLIAQIAFVLSQVPGYAAVAKWMFRSLAFEGEPIATITMAADIIIDGEKSERQILDNLRSIAEEGKIPQAMVLCGENLEQKGQDTQAAEWYEKAMAASKPVTYGSMDTYLRSKVPQPWEAYRSIKERLGEHDEAKKALNVGVEEYEALRAYRRALPDLLDSGDYEKYEIFLNKCAMEGDGPSCHELGNLYLTTYLTRQASQGGDSNASSDAKDLTFADKYPTPTLRELAVEWYKIAAAAGHGQSALVLAGLFRQESKLDMGMEYLNLASQDPGCKKAFDSLQKRWHDTETKVDIKRELMS